MRRPWGNLGPALASRWWALCVFALSLLALRWLRGGAAPEYSMASRNPLYLSPQLFAREHGFDLFFRPGDRTLRLARTDLRGRMVARPRALLGLNHGAVAARRPDGYLVASVHPRDDGDRARDSIAVQRFSVEGDRRSGGTTLEGPFAQSLLGLHLAEAPAGGTALVYGRRGAYGDLFLQELDASAQPRGPLRLLGPYARSLHRWVAAETSAGPALLLAASRYAGHPGLWLQTDTLAERRPEPRSLSADVSDTEPQVLLAAGARGLAAVWTAHNRGRVYFALGDARGNFDAPRLLAEDPWPHELDALLGDGQRWIVLWNDAFEGAGGTTSLLLDAAGAPLRAPLSLAASPLVLSNFVRAEGRWVAAQSFDESADAVPLLRLDDEGRAVR